MKLLIHWILSAAAVVITAYLLKKGVYVGSFFIALIVAVVLGFLNSIIRPILIVLSLPVQIINLGLFTFVINALLVMLASGIIPGFRVNGFGWALLFSLILALVNAVLHHFVPNGNGYSRDK